ncbi:hypothetical protein EAE99_006017 [Botrytis elliptica]|nr:hypothetical protein EAE99_006017 [Botrytis elliptica]
MALRPNFRKHGLILDGTSEALYRAAHISIQRDLELDPKEHETTALMFHLLATDCFSGLDSRYTCAPEYYPDPIKGEKIDIVVRYSQGGGEVPPQKILMIGECKKPLRMTGSHLVKLEWQAYRYCQIYFQSAEGSATTHVFSATMVGAHMRLWRCERDDTFDANREKEPGVYRAYWAEITTGQALPSPDANWSKYRDVGKDANNEYFEQSFKLMKTNPPQPMTTNSQFRGENRMKKLVGDRYGNPGILTSETREVRELTENMQAMGVSSGVNPRTSRSTASSSYTSYTSNPSRTPRTTNRPEPYPQPSNRPSGSMGSASSSRSRPTIDERPNASDNYSSRSTPRSSASSYQRADSHVQRSTGSASGRAPAGYEEASRREESSLRPSRSSDQRISGPSSGPSRVHERGREYSEVRPSRSEPRYEGSSSQQTGQRYSVSSTSSGQREDHRGSYTAPPAPRQRSTHASQQPSRPIHVQVEVGSSDIYFWDGSTQRSTDRLSWLSNVVDGRTVRMFECRSTGRRYYFVPGQDDLQRR